jgi:hypothetical protein
VVQLLKQPRTKRSVKEVMEHLRVNSSGLQMMLDEPTRKKFRKVVKEGFDDGICTQLSLPAQDWAPKVYSPWYFGYARSYVNVQVPHMGAMEARLLLEGDEIVAGIPFEHCEGATLREKVRSVKDIGFDRLRTLITGSGGFACHHDTTKLLVVPTGFLLLIASPAALGVRWSMAGGDSDADRVKHALGGVLNSYLEMGNASTGYSQWRDWLNSMG